jgi:hypothetical protein
MKLKVSDISHIGRPMSEYPALPYHEIALSLLHHMIGQNIN